VPASARTLALEALERARASGALEAGDLKRFYSDVSAAVRAFLAAEDGRLGLDLTTTEVLRALRGRARSARLPELRALLAAADLVKFAGHRPALPAAEQDWQRARDWVLGYETSGLENAA
jgi:hypothetical protein